MDYKFFIDPKMKTSKYLVYKYDNLPIEMVLTTEQMHANSVEGYNICIEKHKTMNLIQIRLSNVRDNTSVFLYTIDDAKFEQFKMEMVEKCRHKKMNVVLSMVNNHMDSHGQMFQLQFYEKGTFKNLVHISLPITPAPYEVILFHINQMYAHSQEENRILMQKNSNFQMELAQKAEQIDRLNGIINGMKINMSELENNFKERHKEQLTRLEMEIKDLNDSKIYQVQEFEKQIAEFKARVESLIKDNHTLNEQLKKETKTSAQLRSDGKKALATISNLNKQLDQLNEERLSQQNNSQKTDKTISELQKQVNELEQKILGYKKQKHELLAELQAEKNICQIKKDGLKMATEDICNANTIIRKQAAEIDILRKKVELRTEVALKQEQVIREAGKGKENLNNLMGKIHDALERNSEQSQLTENHIKSIRDRTNLIESKYRDRIDDLYDKIASISH